VPLERILNTVAAGAVSDDLCSTLAARLTRLDRQIDHRRQQEVIKLTDGKDLKA